MRTSLYVQTDILDYLSACDLLKNGSALRTSSVIVYVFIDTFNVLLLFVVVFVNPLSVEQGAIVMVNIEGLVNKEVI